MAEVVLAVDIGSTWCKAAYLDEQGRTVATGRAYTRGIPAARYETLDRFWTAFAEAVREATGRLPAGLYPGAIAISTRALFGVCLDDSGQATLPAWDAKLEKTSPDYRHAYSTQVWNDKDPFAYGYAIGQAALMLWLKRERADDWRSIQRVGALHDYIVYRMTGEWVTDPTTGPGQAAWPQEILAMTELPSAAWPRILDPEQVAGGLLTDAAGDLGLPTNTPVVVGLHDGAAANLGVRAVQAGDGCFTLGTNFVFRAVTGERLTSKCMGYVVAPGSWAWVSNVPVASPQLDITAQALLGHVPEVSDRHARLGLQADAVAPGADGLVIPLILPGQEGDLHQAVMAARQTGYSDGAIYRALLEAIAFGERNLINRARRDGADPQRFVATGGGAQNAQFLRVLATVLDAPIEMGEPEGGVIGAGMAAAVGAGWYATIYEAMAGMSAPGPIIQPDPDALDYYRSPQHERK